MELSCVNFKKIIIIGYSYGGILGLKLAEKLEKQGNKVKFISLDGSLSLLNTFLINSLKGIEPSYENLKQWLLQQFSFEFLPIAEQHDEFETMTKDSKPEDKLKKALNLAGIQKYSDDFIMKSFYGMLNRLKAVTEISENTNYKLSSNIVLIRSKIGLVNDIAEDYNLRSSTYNDVVIHYSERRHLTILEDQKVLEIIRNECIIE